MQDIIYFYGRKLEHPNFSNFAKFPIVIDGTVWPTTEHYYQAMKFHGTEHEKIIRLLDTPNSAAREGRKSTLPLRIDWESVKDSIMLRAVYEKFTQHKELREELLATGTAFIVEHTKNDHYWGDGCDSKGANIKIGPGKNMLGHVLMHVRYLLLHNESLR